MPGKEFRKYIKSLENYCVLKRDEAKNRISYMSSIVIQSINLKVGWMAKTTHAPLDRSPTQAIKDKKTESNCLDCPIKTECYVNPVSLNAVWEKVIKMEVSEPPKHDRAVRFGDWGDPSTLPIPLIEKVIDSGSGRWTGYTHDWLNCDEKYSQFFMASIEHKLAIREGLSISQLRDVAKAKGYRTYKILLPGEKPEKGEISCPYPRVQCKDCLLCSGTEGLGKKDITTTISGPNNKVTHYIREIEKAVPTY